MFYTLILGYLKDTNAAAHSVDSDIFYAVVAEDPVAENPAVFVDHENVHFSDGNYETRSSKLADANVKCPAKLERSYS